MGSLEYYFPQRPFHAELDCITMSTGHGQSIKLKAIDCRIVNELRNDNKTPIKRFLLQKLNRIKCN